MKVITNNHEREFKYGHEVPESVHKDYDWLEESEHFDGWIHYRGEWYHVSDFMRTEHFDGWDGYISDSFFSGVVIKLSDDCETYRIGLYLS